MFWNRKNKSKESKSQNTQNPFDSLKGEPMSYISHEMLAHIQDDKVIAPPVPSPYALLTVSVKGQEVGFAISHRIDFEHLYRLDKEGYLNTEKFEILIMHKPAEGAKKILASILPSLEYNVFEVKDGSFIDNQIIYAYNQEWEQLKQ